MLLINYCWIKRGSNTFLVSACVQQIFPCWRSMYSTYCLSRLFNIPSTAFLIPNARRVRRHKLAGSFFYYIVKHPKTAEVPASLVSEEIPACCALVVGLHSVVRCLSKLLGISLQINELRNVPVWIILYYCGGEIESMRWKGMGCIWGGGKWMWGLVGKCEGKSHLEYLGISGGYY